MFDTHQLSHEMPGNPHKIGPPQGVSRNRFRTHGRATPVFARKIVLAGLVLGMLTGLTHRVAADETKTPPTTPTLSVSEQIGPRALSRAFRYAARKSTPSVVTILTYGQSKPQPRSPAKPSNPDEKKAPKKEPIPDKNRLTGLGSGVIVSADGLVITNNHVIAGAKRVVVQLSDETEIEATDVFGDPDSDIASLRIAIDPDDEMMRGTEIIPAELADSNRVEIGDWVLAIGSPFKLEATVSAGIISAKNRELTRIKRGQLIQTDAAINPGNSGGPLIDLDGRVVAINTAIATRTGGYQGIGFAIPINQAKWIADELSSHGKVRRAAIGITMVELKPKIARLFKLSPGMGVLAYQVIENSAAQRAGIRPLDVVVEFAGERVSDPASMQSIVERKPIGSTQKVKVIRKGETLELTIEIASIEDPTLSSQHSEKEAEGKEMEGKESTEDARSSNKMEVTDKAKPGHKAETTDKAEDAESNDAAVKKTEDKPTESPSKPLN